MGAASGGLTYVLELVLISVLFAVVALAGPAFVYVIALGAIVRPSNLKVRPFRRLVLFDQAIVVFYGFAFVWTAVVTSGVLGEFDVAERRIKPLALFSIVLVPILSAIVGRIWVRVRSKSWGIEDAP